MGINAKHAYRFGFLKSEKWSNIRLQVLANKDAVCDICDVRDLSNDVHHVYYADRWEETPLQYLMVLCRRCHDEVHKKMETPDAKIAMFISIRKELRKSLGIPLKRLEGFKDTEPAKELRQALDKAKEEIQSLKNESVFLVKIPGENKISEAFKKAEQKQRDNRIRFLTDSCDYCKQNMIEKEFSIDRDLIMKKKTFGWSLWLCSSCYESLKPTSDKIKGCTTKQARDFFNMVKKNSKRKLLTFCS